MSLRLIWFDNLKSNHNKLRHNNVKLVMTIDDWIGSLILESCKGVWQEIAGVDKFSSSYFMLKAEKWKAMCFVQGSEIIYYHTSAYMRKSCWIIELEFATVNFRVMISSRFFVLHKLLEENTNQMETAKLVPFRSELKLVDFLSIHRSFGSRYENEAVRGYPIHSKTVSL